MDRVIGAMRGADDSRLHRAMIDEGERGENERAEDRRDRPALARCENERGDQRNNQRTRALHTAPNVVEVSTSLNTSGS